MTQKIDQLFKKKNEKLGNTLTQMHELMINLEAG